MCPGVPGLGYATGINPGLGGNNVAEQVRWVLDMQFRQSGMSYTSTIIHCILMHLATTVIIYVVLIPHTNHNHNTSDFRIEQL